MNKPADTFSSRAPGMPVFQAGKEQTEAMIQIEKEILETYDQASRSWQPARQCSSMLRRENS